ncbi:MAG: hydrogenase 2 operon protein HybA [Gemmatimonadota bacterium]
MGVDRRTALKTLAGAGAAVAATPRRGEAREPRQPPPDAVGLLYDPTLCIGCKACVVACYEANFDEPPPGELYYDPRDLSATCRNVIKEYVAGAERSFMKMQCMHCVDPGCISACMLGALDKREYGIVTWDADRCVGCRYCQVACAFNVPKFEWDDATPQIVKCELCSHRLAEGLIPACADVCPKEAVIFGPRDELLAEAHRRIEESPGRYESKVYGETDGGGTQNLYLTAAGIPFTDLGLPELGERSTAHTAESVQHMIYTGFAAPVVLYGILGAVVWKTHRQHEIGEAEVGAEREVES